jgi:hypothetical protein
MINTKFIIPQKKYGIIAEFENNKIKEIGKIDVPYSSKSVFLKNRLFVSLCFGKMPKSRRLKIFDEHGNQLLRKAEYKYESINFRDNIIYLGGQYRNKRNDMFSFIDLNNIDFKVNEIDIPIKTIEGKSIDDILIRNNLLLLVDNIVFPKYIFKYDISISNNPKIIGVHELENNGTYEHIIKGDINDNWIILFSSSVNHGVSFQHISIIEKNEDWNKQKCLSFCIDAVGGWRKVDSMVVFDICLIDDNLYILKEDGLYCINLQNKILEKNVRLINKNNEKHDRILKISDEHCLLLNNEEYKLL